MSCSRTQHRAYEDNKADMISAMNGGKMDNTQRYLLRLLESGSNSNVLIGLLFILRKKVKVKIIYFGKFKKHTHVKIAQLQIL